MKLKEYLKADRQWRRVHRIAHAQFQLANATSRRARDFWEKVLRANGVRTWRKPRKKAAPKVAQQVQLKEAA